MKSLRLEYYGRYTHTGQRPVFVFVYDDGILNTVGTFMCNRDNFETLFQYCLTCEKAGMELEIVRHRYWANPEQDEYISKEAFRALAAQWGRRCTVRRSFEIFKADVEQESLNFNKG